VTAALPAAPPEIQPLDHFRLYAYLGLVSVMEPDTEMLMREYNERLWREDEHDSPHDRPWYVSFHASQFPGSQEDACKRYLLYRMMNLPGDGPMPPWVTTTGDVGKAGELTIARAWFAGGRSLAIPEDDAAGTHQLGFRNTASWMTASTDLPILKPGWKRPHIVEIKGKADEVLEEMLNGYWDSRLNRRVTLQGLRPRRELQARSADDWRDLLLVSLVAAEDQELLLRARPDLLAARAPGPL
jgi:hypothetical protein